VAGPREGFQAEFDALPGKTKAYFRRRALWSVGTLGDPPVLGKSH